MHRPKISDSRLLWLQVPEGAKHHDVYMCHLEWSSGSCAPTRLPLDQESYKNSVAFSGNLVAWASEKYYTDRDIVTYNLDTKQENFISIRWDEREEDIVLTPSFIAWTGDPSSFNFERFGYFSRLVK